MERFEFKPRHFIPVLGASSYRDDFIRACLSAHPENTRKRFSESDLSHKLYSFYQVGVSAIFLPVIYLAGKGLYDLIN